MAASEAKLTKDLMKHLKQHGAFTIVLAGGSAFQPRGLPDRVVCHKILTRPVFLEFKINNNMLTEIQKFTIQEINEHCPKTAFVVRFIEDKVMRFETHEKEILAVCDIRHFLTTLERIMK